MYEVPIDTIDRPIAFAPAPQVQPNTPAPIELYQGNMQWLTPRNMAIGIGGVVMAAILFVSFRGSAAPETIKVGAIQNTEPSSQEVNKLILENSKASLDDLKIATNLKMEEIYQSSINERSLEILAEAQKHVANPKSPSCYRSPHGTACYVTVFIAEQNARYADAISVRQWNKANNALFDVKAARTALDGIKPVPFTPAVTSAAIIKENELRINLAQQSDNAIATDLYGARTKR